jgi:hypothetical protein
MNIYLRRLRRATLSWDVGKDIEWYFKAEDGKRDRPTFLNVSFRKMSVKTEGKTDKHFSMFLERICLWRQKERQTNISQCFLSCRARGKVKRNVSYLFEGMVLVGSNKEGKARNVCWEKQQKRKHWQPLYLH